MKLKYILALIPLALVLAVAGCEQNTYDETTPGTTPGETQTNQPPEAPPTQP